MNYYIFKPAVNTPETGPEYPQVQKMKPGYDYKAPNSVHAVSRSHDRFPDFEPDMDYFILHSRAKLTDLLSVTPISGGLLVSERLKDLFEKFPMVAHHFYSAKIQHKKTLHENYFWMHILSDFTNQVNYPLSTFFIYQNYTHNIGYIEISSKEDYFTKKAKIKENNPGKTVTIWAEKIQMNPEFDKNINLFEIGSFNSDCFISTELKEELIAQNITGCDIKLATNIIIE